MAKTYTITSSSTYDGRKMILTCTQVQDIANNKSTINWTLKTEGGSMNYYTTGPTTVKINGVVVYSKERTGERVFPCAVGSVSGSTSVAHNNDGSKSISVSLTTAIWYGEYYAKTDSGTWTLDNNPRAATLTSAQDFNDTQNPTITYNNPSGNVASSLQACISFTGSNDDIPYRDVSKTGSSYTFNLTDAERQTLLNATLSGKTSRTVYFYLKTVIGGQTFYKWLAKTFTVIDCEPEISVIFSDIDSYIYENGLTGNDALYIKHESDLNYVIQATTKKGASISSYKAECGTQSANTADGTLVNIDGNSVKFTITDNRGNSKSLEYALDVIEYVRPTVNLEASITMSGETEATANLNISGKYFSGSLGAVDNTLTIYYRHKTNNGEFGDWVNTTITSPSHETEYSGSFKVSGLDYSEAHTFQVRVQDKINEAISLERTLTIYPVFDWSKTDFNFNVPVSFQGDTMVDMIIDQGTAAMGSNGTWYWTKWKSGRAECYGVRNYGNMAVNVAWGSAMYCSQDFTQDLPSGLFVDAPDFQNIHVYRAGNACWITQGYGGVPSASSTNKFCVCYPYSSTISQVYLTFDIKGRWK